MWCIGAVYCLMLVPSAHNTIRYVILQKRYTVFLLTVYYSLANVTISLRLIEFFHLGVEYSINHANYLWYGDNVLLMTQQLKLAIGIFQYASIAELYYRMEHLDSWREQIQTIE